jgi:hypothetical protein
MVGQSIHERKLREERENQVADEPEENVECQMLQLPWPRVLFLIHICPAPLLLTRYKNEQCTKIRLVVNQSDIA